MQAEDREDSLLRSVALQNAQSILLARQQAEEELMRTKEALEKRTDELEHSLAMMRATLESTTDGILVTDRDGKITGYNAQFAEMWKAPAAILERGEHRELLEVTSRCFADPQSFLARIEDIYASSPPETYDLLETRDGKSIERFSRIQFVADRNVGRVWSFRDITARTRSERALREETGMLELLNETGTRLSSELDLRTLVQAVTDSATQLSGAKFGAFFYNVMDAKGESFLLYTLSGAPREAFEKFGLPRNTPIFEPTFHGKGVVRSADITRHPLYGRMEPHHGMPEGHLPVRSYLAVPVILRSGTVIGGLFFGHPGEGVFSERTEHLITGIASQAAIAMDNARLYDDLKQLAEERQTLLHAEREARTNAQRVSFLKDEFLANLSHELRTPLNAILGWSQIIASGKATGDDLQQGLETIARNARAQVQLIDDLLDMSRIDSGKVRLDVQQTDLGAIVLQAVSTVRPSAEAKGIHLRRIMDPLIGPVSGDPNRLQQVIWNLLSNAVKFTPKGGKVDVILQRVNSCLELTINDSGIGIKPEFLPFIFERFRQADSSATRVYGGLGLGLSIAKQLVELHGGTIQALSPGDGKGATFIVSLPLAPLRERDVREHPATPKTLILECDGIDLGGVRVLVVEDETDARELIRRALLKCHADVLTASSAAEALQIMRTLSPHVLVSDIGMPDIDGYQLIRQVRRLPAAEGGTVPAIALTAFARSEDRTRALLAGYQMHIAKPIELQELVATVASIAGRTSRGTEPAE